MKTTKMPKKKKNTHAKLALPEHPHTSNSELSTPSFERSPNFSLRPSSLTVISRLPKTKIISLEAILINVETITTYLEYVHINLTAKMATD